MKDLKDKLFAVLGVKTANEAKEKFSQLVDEPKAVEYKDLTLQDGSVLLLDGELAVGSSVMVKTESGDAPAPDGEYILQDGSKIVVMGGKISEVGKTEEEPIEEGMSSDELKGALEGFEKRIKSLEDLLLQAGQKSEQEKTAMKSQEDKVSKLIDLVEKVLEMPAQEPVKQEVFRNEKADKFAEMARTLEALKKRK
jgi:hypothetical protein